MALSPEDFKRFKMMQDFALHVGDILGLVMDILRPRTHEDSEKFAFDLELELEGLK